MTGLLLERFVAGRQGTEPLFTLIPACVVADRPRALCIVGALWRTTLSMAAMSALQFGNDEGTRDGD